MPTSRLAVGVLVGMAWGAPGCASDSGGVPTCTDGTRLNATTHACEPDPNACQGGTVLINGACLDPANGLVVDLEEGPEPNGLGGYDYIDDVMLEASDAGAIALKPVGDSFVIHGCIAPVYGKPDYDGYTLTVPGPTLLDVTVDGVGGLTPGFFVDLDLWPVRGIFIQNYRRSAVTLSGDTSQRELFLPTAGTYRLFIADTRSLLWNFPFGSADKTTCYYASIAQRTPAPIPLDLSAPTTGQLDGKVKLYTIPGGDRFTHVTTAVDVTPSPLEPLGGQTPRAVLVGADGELRQVGTATQDGTGTRGNSELRFGGPDSVLIAVDIDRHFAAQAPSFTISAEQYGNPLPLSTDGRAVRTTVNGTTANTPMPLEWCLKRYVCAGAGGDACCYGPNYLGYNYFYYDVSDEGEFAGMKLQFSIPIQGGVFTQDGESIADFGGEFGTHTVTEFAGIVRARQPGRYYVWLFAPDSSVHDPLTVTSTYRPLVPTPLAVGSPLALDLDPVFHSNIFTYDPNRPGWQQLSVSGSNTGEVVITRYHPSVYGRFDPLTTTDEFGQTSTDQGAPRYPEFGLFDPGTASFPEDGSGLRSEVSFGTPSPLYVKVSASAPTASSRFTLGVASRPSAHDFGTLAAGSTTTLAAQTITAAPPTDLQRYLLATAPGNLVTITVTPTLGFDAVIATLKRDEIDQAVYNATTSGAEVAKFRQDSTGGTAFVVRSATPAPGAYTITITIQPPYYRLTSSTTIFEDACVGGTRVALVADGSFDPLGNLRSADDNGLSETPIATPAGFRFYGMAVPSLVVSTNGFFSFDTRIRNSISSPVTCGFENNQMVCKRLSVPGTYEPPPMLVAASVAGTLPDGVGTAHVAPYWNNLKNVVVCHKTVGSRLVVQWTGISVSFWDELGTGAGFGQLGPGLLPLQWDGGRPVQMQAILDASDQSIEFVYGPKLFVRSDTGGSGGVQDPSGFDGTESFDCHHPPFPSGTLPKAMTSVKFTHP